MLCIYGSACVSSLPLRDSVCFTLFCGAGGGTFALASSDMPVTLIPLKVLTFLIFHFTISSEFHIFIPRERGFRLVLIIGRSSVPPKPGNDQNELNIFSNALFQGKRSLPAAPTGGSVSRSIQLGCCGATWLREQPNAPPGQGSSHS